MNSFQPGKICRRFKPGSYLGRTEIRTGDYLGSPHQLSNSFQSQKICRRFKPGSYVGRTEIRTGDHLGSSLQHSNSFQSQKICHRFKPGSYVGRTGIRTDDHSRIQQSSILFQSGCEKLAFTVFKTFVHEPKGPKVSS